MRQFQNNTGAVDNRANPIHVEKQAATVVAVMGLMPESEQRTVPDAESMAPEAAIAADVLRNELTLNASTIWSTPQNRPSTPIAMRMGEG